MAFHGHLLYPRTASWHLGEGPFEASFWSTPSLEPNPHRYKGMFSLCISILLFCSLSRTVEARGCQVRNHAGRPVDFYWMDVVNWGTYITQTPVPMPNETSFALKTYESHRFFVAWGDEAGEVQSWDPNSIPLNAQFVHRGYDQVVTALVDKNGQLYLQDWDVHEWGMDRLVQAIEQCNLTTSGNVEKEDAQARCVMKQANTIISRFKRERDSIKAQVDKMQTRMAGSFCTGTGRFQTPARRTFEWEGRQVNVLADTGNVSVFHLPAFLDVSGTTNLITGAPPNGTRYLEVFPNPKMKFDASLVEAQAWGRAFVQSQLGGSMQDKTSDKEPLRIFRYDKKEFHAPPCDGICQKLLLPSAEYAATLIMYPQHSKQADRDRTAWYFTTEDANTDIGFTSQGNDAVLFLYKNPTVGYAPALLPQLIPCISMSKEMFVSSTWIRRPVDEKEKRAEGSSNSRVEDEL